MSPQQVYVVGRFPDPDESDSWELQGVFLLEAHAVEACRDWRHFYGSIPVNVDLGQETVAWGVTYPHRRPSSGVSTE